MTDLEEKVGKMSRNVLLALTLTAATAFAGCDYNPTGSQGNGTPTPVSTRPYVPAGGGYYGYYGGSGNVVPAAPAPAPKPGVAPAAPSVPRGGFGSTGGGGSSGS